MLDLIYYKDRRGKSPFVQGLHELDFHLRGRIEKAVSRLALGNFGDHRHLGSGLFENRQFISGGGGLRIYFGRDGKSLVVLVLCGNKASQEADIQKSRLYWADYLKDKNR